jgi:CubicO group peptidase (beta-lactamase class C family)
VFLTCDRIQGSARQQARQSYYQWPGTAQMYSSARDLARFLAANLGELPIDPVLHAAIQDAHHGIFPMSRRVTQGLAWEVDRGPPLIIEKNGGLNNTTTYMGMMPGEKLGVVILSNLGSENAGAGIGRRIMRTLAPSTAEAFRDRFLGSLNTATPAASGNGKLTRLRVGIR